MKCRGGLSVSTRRSPHVLRTSSFPDGTRIWIGSGGALGRAYLALANKRWAKIVPGKNYRIVGIFDSRQIWNALTTGFEHQDMKGVDGRDLKMQFIEDIARSNSMVVASDGLLSADLSLRGIRAAADAIDACLKQLPNTGIGRDAQSRKKTVRR